MGISQSLQKAVHDHPRFSKVQYGMQTDITVIHYDLDDCEMKEWRKKYHQRFGEFQLLEEGIRGRKIKEKYPYLLVADERNIRVVRDGFCSQKIKVLIKMEKLWQTTLLKEIQQRRSIQRHYSEQQIWLVMLQITQTLLPLQQKSPTSTLGNLHPSNILINQQGQLILVGQCSLPKEKDHFLTFKESGVKKSFVSPQLVGFLSKKTYKEYPNYPSCVDPQKVEAYSLGLCLLSLCCLQHNLSPLYNLSPRNINYIQPHISRQASSRHNYWNLINQQFFNQKLHFIENNYSRMLSMVVKCLLQNKPQDRLSVKQLWMVLLEEKRGYIMAMDERWYLEALETIQEFDDNCGNEDLNEEETDVNNSPQYPKSHHPSTDLECFSMIQHKVDQHLLVWENSLQKQDKNFPQKVKKVSFNYA